MYKIICQNVEGDKLVNRTLYETGNSELSALSVVLIRETNNAGTLSLSIAATHPYYTYVNSGSLIIVKIRGVTKFTGELQEEETDLMGTKNFSCMGVLCKLSYTIQDYHESLRLSPKNLLQLIINKHNEQIMDSRYEFTLDQVTVTDPNDMVPRTMAYQTSLEALKEKLVDPLGGNIIIRYDLNDCPIMDYLDSVNSMNSQGLTFGKNVLDIAITADHTSVYSAVIPLGAKLEESEQRVTIASVNNNKRYLYDEDAVNRMGWKYLKAEFDDITTPNALKTRGQQLLETLPYLGVSLEIRAIDLNKVDDRYDAINVGQTIRFRQDASGLDILTPVYKIVDDITQPQNSMIYCGTTIPSFAADSANSNGAMDALKRSLSNIMDGDGNIMAQRVKGALDLMQTSLSAQKNIAQTSDVRAILFEDTNPASATYGAMSIGTQGLQIARQWNTALDEWSWGTAIDFKTVNADMMLTGTISDRYGHNYWNLDTGEFHLSAMSGVAGSEDIEGVLGDLGDLRDEMNDNIDDVASDLEAYKQQTSATLTVMNTAITAKVSKGSVSNQLSIETGGINISGNRFTVSSSNFNLTAAGTMTCTNGNFNGRITATSGSVGGFSIGGATLMTSNQLVGMSTGAAAYWAGNNVGGTGSLNLSRFLVYNTGDVYGQYANFKQFLINGQAVAKQGEDYVLFYNGTKIVHFDVNVYPIANTVTCHPVAFASRQVFCEKPSVYVSAITQYAGTNVKGCTARDRTKLGFNIFLNRTTDSMTTVSCLCIGKQW